MAITEKKYVIFTDIKEFTYKNALLTSNQVEAILKIFDDIIMKAAEVYKIQVVKSMGDAYLCLGDSRDQVLEYSNHIIAESQKYDATQKLSIKKISLRSAISYGTVTKNKAMKLDDYFGEPINLAARIISITPEARIFLSKEAAGESQEKDEFQKVGQFDFHGIIDKTTIISTSTLTPEQMLDVDTHKKSILEECDTIVFRAACVCAILSAQPIPFVESINIIGIHLYMIIKISQKFGEPVNMRGARDIFGKIIPQLSLGYFAFMGANTGIKILLPGIGGYLFSPLSFGVAYAMGKIYVAYFCYEGSHQRLSKDVILGIFKRQKDNGVIIAKENKKKIFQTGKEYYKDILSIRKQSGYTKIQKDLTRMLKGKK